jgi:hypothetical protein
MEGPRPSATDPVDRSAPPYQDYIRRAIQAGTQRQARIDSTVPDEILLAATTSPEADNPIFTAVATNPGEFYDLCGFPQEHFMRLYEPLAGIFSSPRGGRARRIEAIDSFFLLLHWLKTGSSIATIAAGFKLKKETLYARIQGVIERVHDNLVGRYITSHADLPFPRQEECPECTLIVDATVQERPKPTGPIQNRRNYLSRKHDTHCLKSQVMINRGGFAVHIVAGVPGATPDLELFREHLSSVEELIDRHPREPCDILADEAYTGHVESRKIRLVTPHTPDADGHLLQWELRENQVISQNRVLIENYFGRLAMKFHILIRVWKFDEALYPRVFAICCALVNFEIAEADVPVLGVEEGDFHRKRLTLMVTKSQEKRNHHGLIRGPTAGRTSDADEGGREGRGSGAIRDSAIDPDSSARDSEDCEEADAMATEREVYFSNAYLYRHLPPGEQSRHGPWTPEEHERFLVRLHDWRGDTGLVPTRWGLFSEGILGRVGYQCRQHYRCQLPANQGGKRGQVHEVRGL